VPIARLPRTAYPQYAQHQQANDGEPALAYLGQSPGQGQGWTEHSDIHIAVCHRRIGLEGKRHQAQHGQEARHQYTRCGHQPGYLRPLVPQPDTHTPGHQPGEPVPPLRQQPLGRTPIIWPKPDRHPELIEVKNHSITSNQWPGP
jgi:hypothetical protein